ncbi:hypothetical protein Pelo_947 [Pelomyxa schiedti]|nr:hypothetical protein Pelo_947 [Pelomyxa schiedti]
MEEDWGLKVELMSYFMMRISLFPKASDTILSLTGSNEVEVLQKDLDQLLCMGTTLVLYSCSQRQYTLIPTGCWLHVLNLDLVNELDKLLENIQQLRSTKTSTFSFFLHLDIDRSLISKPYTNLFSQGGKL